MAVVSHVAIMQLFYPVNVSCFMNFVGEDWKQHSESIEKQHESHESGETAEQFFF